MRRTGTPHRDRARAGAGQPGPKIGALQRQPRVGAAAYCGPERKEGYGRAERRAHMRRPGCKAPSRGAAYRRNGADARPPLRGSNLMLHDQDNRGVASNTLLQAAPLIAL